LIALIWGVISWLRGTLPTLIRLGNAISTRKIAIFASVNHLGTLKGLLLDSKLFKEKNLLEISEEDDFGRAERAKLWLIFWPDWKDSIAQILSLHKDNTALIVYAPEGPRSVPDDKLGELNKKRHITLVNARGRLLNDVFTSLITTGHD
jgi:hypothetical protein